MAVEAGLSYVAEGEDLCAANTVWYAGSEELVRVANLVDAAARAEERQVCASICDRASEQCAKIATQLHQGLEQLVLKGAQRQAEKLAHVIRLRSDETIKDQPKE